MNKLPIHPFTLTFQAEQEAIFPDYPGSMLRGIFGDALKTLEKKHKIPVVEGHSLRACLFDNVLADEKHLEILNKNDKNQLTSGFWFTLNENIQKCYIPGDMLSFSINLCGYYVEWLEMLLPVFVEMGIMGMGADKGKFRLISVTQTNAFGESRFIWKEHSGLTEENYSGINILNYSRAVPVHNELTVFFETPVALTKIQNVFGGIPFKNIIESLGERYNNLSVLYGNTSFEMHEAYLKFAHSIRIVESHLTWNEYTRKSFRKDEKAPIEGYTGMIRYKGPVKSLTHYLPLLLLGQHLHVGRNIVFGAGKYTVDKESYTFNG